MFSLTCALNKRLNKQSWGWWFETPSLSLWRHNKLFRYYWKCRELELFQNYSRQFLSDPRNSLSNIVCLTIKTLGQFYKIQFYFLLSPPSNVIFMYMICSNTINIIKVLWILMVLSFSYVFQIVYMLKAAGCYPWCLTWSMPNFVPIESILWLLTAELVLIRISNITCITYFIFEKFHSDGCKPHAHLISSFWKMIWILRQMAW